MTQKAIDKTDRNAHVVVSKRLVLVNSISSVFTRLLNISVLLWMYQYLLSKISAEEFAIYPVLSAALVFAPLFFSFFVGGISRHVVDAYSLGDKIRVRRIISSMVPLLGMYSILFLSIGLLFTLNIRSLLTLPDDLVEMSQLMLILMLLSFATQMVTLPLTVGFHVKQRFVLLNGLMIFRDILRILLLLSLLVGVSASVLWIVVATVISELVYLVLQIRISRNLVPELSVDRSFFHWSTAREITSFGMWTTLGRLGNLMYTNAATIVLNKTGSATDVTSYYLGAMLFNQINHALGSALLPLQPAFTAMSSIGDDSKFGNTFLRGGRYALWISLAVAAPLAIYSERIVQLYVGAQFASAAHVIILFMICLPFTKATALLPMAAIATARVKPFYLGSFIAQFIGLALMVYFSTWLEMGAVGVTLALAIITIGSQLMYFWPLSFRIAKVPSKRFLSEVLVPGLLPALLGGVVWSTLNWTFQPTSWVSLLSCGLVGLLAYFATLGMFCLQKTDKKELSYVMEKIRRAKS